MPILALATGALGWRLATMPYPDERTWAELSRSVGHQERREVDRALRRGDDVEPAHHAYAIARVARQRRTLVSNAAVTSIVWGQVLLAADRGTPAVWFWTVLVISVVVTVTFAGSLVLQLRRERTARSRLSNPRRI